MVYELYLNKTVTQNKARKQKQKNHGRTKPSILVGLLHPKLPTYYLEHKNLEVISTFQSYSLKFVNVCVYVCVCQKLEAMINQSN